jgi:hypothetical protein
MSLLVLKNIIKKGPFTGSIYSPGLLWVLRDFQRRVKSLPENRVGINFFD